MSDAKYSLTKGQKLYLPLKRGIDIVLSGLGIIILSPVLLGIALAIKVESPGPVLFKQERVGKNKKIFKIWKFRSMRTDTPKDMPTHMLANPEQYITKIGHFIRKTSLDELPQIFNIFKGEMSIIGPRPALWNQYDLIEERDKYGANDIAPGLTGWAQINGRDELEIPIKAKLDGEYVKKMGFLMDVKCFFGTILSVLKSDGVVEGGTGEMKHRTSFEDYKNMNDFDTEPTKTKKIMITGAGSYIGEAVKEYLEKNSPEYYKISVFDTQKYEPTAKVFETYDVVFNVAGIAHIKEKKENRHLYYDINRDLVVKIAKSAKKAGVEQFILLSSMSVYGKRTGCITKDSETNPKSAYGISKMQADQTIKKLADDHFKIAFLRPPMVYGLGCKGNYQSLRKFALKSPVFPNYHNERSMIYIGNLCEFVKRIIDTEADGLFFPQNKEYVSTSEMVREIAKVHRKDILETKIFNPIINILPINIVKKVFGNLIYCQVDTVSKFDFKESIKLTEGIKDER